MIKPRVLMFLMGAAQAVEIFIPSTDPQCAQNTGKEWNTNLVVVDHPKDGNQDFMSYAVDAQWKQGVYYVERENDENGHFLFRGPDYAPKKQDNKKRIVVMGDSLADDNAKWGWVPHLAYQIAQDKLPFELLNFARGGATLAQPAMFDTSRDSCYWGGKDDWNSKVDHVKCPQKYRFQGDTTPRFNNAKGSNPDIAIIQFGTNDVVPYCFMNYCKKVEKTPPKIPDCFFDGTTEEAQFQKIKEGLKNLIMETKAFPSKPDVVLMSPVPMLSCCFKGNVPLDGDTPESRPHMIRYLNEKFPPILAEVAKETGVKYIDLFEIFKNKPEQEICDQQQLVGGPGWCNAFHYGRVEIMEQLNKTIIQPQIEKDKEVKLLATKIQAEAEAKITQAVVQPKSSA